jgi:outer membrane protein
MMVSDLVKELRRTVEGIGKKNKYTVILERSAQAVLYADNSIDITDEVIKQFNEQTKDKKF